VTAPVIRLDPTPEQRAERLANYQRQLVIAEARLAAADSQNRAHWEGRVRRLTNRIRRCQRANARTETP